MECARLTWVWVCTRHDQTQISRANNKFVHTFFVPMYFHLLKQPLLGCGGMWDWWCDGIVEWRSIGRFEWHKTSHKLHKTPFNHSDPLVEVTKCSKCWPQIFLTFHYFTTRAVLCGGREVASVTVVGCNAIKGSECALIWYYVCSFQWLEIFEE